MISKLTTHNVLLSSVPVVPHGDTKRRVLPEVDFVVVRVLEQVVRLTGVRGDRDHGWLQGLRSDAPISLGSSTFNFSSGVAFRQGQVFAQSFFERVGCVGSLLGTGWGRG